MINNLKFDFTVNKENNTVNISREFAASLELVWEAWTNPEILDKWWAPKPYITKTKSMDFREGGMWLYAMIGPKNETHWCKADFKKIKIHESFSYRDYFCDENGNVGNDFPNSFWTNSFIKNTKGTSVKISIQYESLEALEKVIEMGFEEGFTMGINQLDELLKTIKE